MGIDVPNDRCFGDCYRHISETNIGVNLEGNGELIALSWNLDRRLKFYTIMFTESVGNSIKNTSIQIFTICSI
jgi:hypothetical protein